jgi:hypothetical protein
MKESLKADQRQMTKDKRNTQTGRTFFRHPSLVVGRSLTSQHGRNLYVRQAFKFLEGYIS